MHVPISGIISLFRSIGGYLLANLAVVPPVHPGDKLERNGRVFSRVQYQSMFPASSSFLPRLWNLRAIAVLSIAQGVLLIHDKGNCDDSIKLPLRRDNELSFFFFFFQRWKITFFFGKMLFRKVKHVYSGRKRHSWEWSRLRNLLLNVIQALMPVGGVKWFEEEKEGKYLQVYVQCF